MKRLIMLSAAALLATSWMVAPATAHEHESLGNVDNGHKIFQEGIGDAVPACASCHGADAMGDDSAGTPRLAYQVETYIRKQLQDFASKKRMDNTMYTMNDVAAALTEQQRRDVAAYVHSLETPFLGSDLDQLREDGEDVGTVYKGQMIVKYGIPENGVPACKSCHGYNGRSAGNLFPKIGGQRYMYLKHELEAFRAGNTTPSSEDDASRDNDPMAIMRHVAAKLTDEDILNAAAYLTVAKESTPGNPKAPKH